LHRNSTKIAEVVLYGVDISAAFCPLSCIHFIYIYRILLYDAKQNFKISTSEYLRCASKCAISRLNNQKFSGEGAQPPPPVGRGHPLLAPHPHRRLQRLAPSAPRYAPKLKSCLRHWPKWKYSGVLQTISNISSQVIHFLSVEMLSSPQSPFAIGAYFLTATCP